MAWMDDTVEREKSAKWEGSQFLDLINHEIDPLALFLPPRYPQPWKEAAEMIQQCIKVGGGGASLTL